MADLSIYMKAAKFERKLKQLPPGQRMRVTSRELLQMQVPANPLDRQTPQYLSEWFRTRMPFRCMVYHNIVSGDYEFTNEENK